MPLIKRPLFLLLTCLLLGISTAMAAQLPALTLQVKGVQGEMQKNVELRLQIERREVDSHLNAAEVAAFARDSVAAVRAALQPYGYYSPVVTSEVQQSSAGWVVKYQIMPGTPVVVREVNVNITGEGRDNKKIRRAASSFPLQSGDIFNSVIYTKARDKLFDVISNEGYIKAVTKDSKVLVNTETHSAIINLTINTNQRYYFGKVSFSKNAYDPEFMQRFDIFKPNEPFSSDKLLQYQQDMNNSRYFKQVLVIPDLTNTNGDMVPIQASAIPANYRRYDFGLGYGTLTKLRVTAGIQLRRLTDTGQSLEAITKLSTVLSGVGVKYYIPGANPLTEQWNIGANFQKFSPKNGYSRSKTVTFGYTHKWRRWTLAANMNYLWERYKVTTQPYHNSQLIYPSLNLSYVKTDNIVQPTYGRSLNFTLEGASSNALSSSSFLQGELKGKLFMTPFSFGHLILRGNLGYTVVKDLNDLPLSMRFFTGGMNSIRGFGDSAIGPGKYLGVGSIEYHQHIAYDISGAAFYDVGTATNHIGTPLDRGVGVGLVYESVVGPIKLYLAEAISKPGHPRSVVFSMGPEF